MDLILVAHGWHTVRQTSGMTRMQSRATSPPVTKYSITTNAGWMGHSWGFGTTTAYGAVRFAPSQDSTLTAVDFWAVVPDMKYKIKIFDTINQVRTKYTFSNQLGTTQTGTTNESGYYSIPLNTPVQLSSRDDFIVQVKFTTNGSDTHLVPLDYAPAPWHPFWLKIAKFSGESYISQYGTQFEKPSYINISGVGTEGIDIGIRARAGAVTPTAAPTPSPTTAPTPTPTAVPTSTPTPSPPGFEAVFAIASLLAIAYFVRRREKA